MFVGGLPSELDGFRTFVTFVTFVTFQQLWLRPIDPGSIIGDRNTGKFDLFRARSIGPVQVEPAPAGSGNAGHKPT